MPQLPHRKSPPASIARPAGPTPTRPLCATASANAPAYVGLVALARRLGLVGVVALAPLGALAGTVSACGGAAPVQPWTDADDARNVDAHRPDGRVPAEPTIAPSANAANAANADEPDAPKPIATDDAGAARVDDAGPDGASDDDDASDATAP